MNKIDELEQRIARLERHVHTTSPGGFTGGPNYPQSSASADSPQSPTPAS